jgi:hypothetical protein
MTKGKKRQHGQGYKILPIIKGIEMAILVMIAVYKGVKLVIEEIRTQSVSSQPSDLTDRADQWRLK